MRIKIIQMRRSQSLNTSFKAPLFSMHALTHQVYFSLFIYLVDGVAALVVDAAAPRWAPLSPAAMAAGVSDTFLRFDVPTTAPSVMSYDCVTHSNRGFFNVIDDDDAGDGTDGHGGSDVDGGGVVEVYSVTATDADAYTVAGPRLLGTASAFDPSPPAARRDRAITLRRGGTYVFDIVTGAAHPVSSALVCI
jgi:hypothetical protein